MQDFSKPKPERCFFIVSILEILSEGQPMSAAFQYDIFLSHNSADKPRLRRLAERLRAANLRVWFDEWIIQPEDDPSPVGRERVVGGQVRDRELAIERGLEASRTLVLCLSPAALGSDWVGLACTAEASRRRRKRSTDGRGNLPFRDPANAGRRFIPLLLTDGELSDPRGLVGSSDASRSSNLMNHHTRC